MPLAAGTRLGPYEIVAPLGAGGMGEVYRARDTRLGRDVAVKVLPQHLSSSPEIRARFEREAKTVSSLNHPNICTLFDVGREGETDYLVLELVDGETLSTRLSRGALPPAEVLKLGAQIADALDRAHRAGVIHRDLKPGNVMLTRSGAKLMDFGLARATGLAGPGGGSGVTAQVLTQSPTVAAPLTAEGTIVGTFQYMSPEQLEGREADARSDIWALGCVLYEMATGRRAFGGATQASLISAIMRDVPQPLGQLAPMSPPGLERLVQQCIAKDPDERWQSAGDVRRELSWLMGQSSSSGAPRSQAIAPRRRPHAALVAWAAVATVAAGALAWNALARRGAQGGAAILTLPMAERTTLSADPFDQAISPDGRRIAFVAVDSSGVNHLCVRAVDEASSRIVPETETASHPFWSPDGGWIGYFTYGSQAQLKKVAVDGGSPIALCDVEWSRGGAWNRKGDILFAPMSQGPLYRISSSGGAMTQVTWLDSTFNETAHRAPSFLPDGEHFVFSALPSGAEGYAICVGSLHSRVVKRIGFAGTAATYAEPGYLLFQRGKQLLAQRFDTRRLQLVGDVVPLAPAPAPSAQDATRIATASIDGRLAVLDSAVPKRRLEVFDATGRSLGRVPMASGEYIGPVLSPDGHAMELADFEGPSLMGLVRIDLARGTTMRLEEPRAYNFTGPWSPDGRSIAYISTRTGREEIYVRSSESGAGEAKLVPTLHGQFKSPADWSPDGRSLLFYAIEPKTANDLFVLDWSSGKVSTFSNSPGSETPASFSPDGRWVQYDSDETGRTEAFVRSFPDGGHKIQVTTGGCASSEWSTGGREIVFLGPDHRTVGAVPFTPGDPPSIGTPRVLFRLATPSDPLSWTASKTGERLYFLVPDEETPDPSLTVIVNWTALMARK